MIVVKWPQKIPSLLNSAFPEWDFDLNNNASIGTTQLSHARLPSRIPLPESVMVQYSEFRHKTKNNITIQIVCAPDGSTLTPLQPPRKISGVHATFQAPALATILVTRNYNLPPDITIAIHKPVADYGDICESTTEIWYGNEPLLPPNLQHFTPAVQAALAKLACSKCQHKHYYTKDKPPRKNRKKLLWSPIVYVYPNRYGDKIRETCSRIAKQYFPELYSEPITVNIKPLAQFGLDLQTIGDLAFGSPDLYGIFIFGAGFRDKLAAFQYLDPQDRQIAAKCRALVRHALETLKTLDVINEMDKHGPAPCSPLQ